MVLVVVVVVVDPYQPSLATAKQYICTGKYTYIHIYIIQYPVRNMKVDLAKSIDTQKVGFLHPYLISLLAGFYTSVIHPPDF